jgi:uncharacterized caspase-like protein
MRFSVRRRRLIEAGVAALLLPSAAGAQSGGATQLLRAPKRALVVGNGRYATVRELLNTGNDARDMARLLAVLGFSVDVLLDADRVQMMKAIEAHRHAVEEQRAVSLFYFAGHGVQLGWRNYLLPVDVLVRRAEDIPAQCVDVSAMAQGPAKARNPMNVIILDACRDNPFGELFRTGQQGLSQMDAPPGTLLAYATAPGNQASDGDAGNGLYTANLLREMAVREAKIEDVFKRVRLAVRRASAGAQVPWESTSLEEDFYFVPPESLARLSAAEEEREFREELALYGRASAATSPEPLEAYLRRHPSGRFTELAQLRLDALLAAQGERPVQPVGASGNPHTVGSHRADTQFRVGDSFTYRMEGGGGDAEFPPRYTQTVTSITGTEVRFNDGQLVVDLLGNLVRSPFGESFTPRQDQPLEFAVGRRWTTRFEVSKAGRATGTMQLDYRIVRRESIEVPAGRFDCYRVESSGALFLPGAGPIDLYGVAWFAPDRVRRFVAREGHRRTTTRGHVRTLVWQRHELVSFTQA